jgi:CubicO group peptidase (beta-lactamase class C family)
MKRSVALLTLASVLFLTGAAWAQGLPTAKPEEVGISSERLQRVSRALRGEIDNGKIPGAVALVARKGRVVYFESFGVRDKAVGDPMPKGRHLPPLLHDQAVHVGGGHEIISEV